MQSSLSHFLLGVVRRFLVDVGKPALARCRPAKYDAFGRRSHDIVEYGGLVLSRNVLHHFQTHHPVVFRQPELRQDQIQKTHGTIRSFLDERRPVVRIVLSYLFVIVTP